MMTGTGKLFVLGVTPATLLLHRCGRCGERNVLGFWQQLGAEVDRPSKRARVGVVCSACGAQARKTYRLTTGRAVRPRLCSWVAWGWAVMPYLPRRSYRLACKGVLWLEAWVRF